MNHRVLIRQRTGATSQGRKLPAWEDVATVWADVQVLRGREWFAANANQATADVRVRIRFRNGIDGTLQVIPQAGSPLAGQPLDVQGIPIVDGQRRYIEMMCMAGVKDGR